MILVAAFVLVPFAGMLLILFLNELEGNNNVCFAGNKCFAVWLFRNP
jgi:hypothetical protein